MTPEKLERLLREDGQLHPDAPLFAPAQADRLRARLAAGQATPTAAATPEDAGDAAPARRSAPTLRVFIAAAAAAILCVLFILPASSRFTEPRIAFEIDIGEERAALFHTLRDGNRSATGAAEFYVGVRTEETGWLQLVGITRRCDAAPLALNASGALALEINAGTVRSFGGYARNTPADGNDGQLTHVIAVITPQQVRSVVPPRQGVPNLVESSAQCASQMASEIARRFGASVRIVDLATHRS